MIQQPEEAGPAAITQVSRLAPPDAHEEQNDEQGLRRMAIVSITTLFSAGSKKATSYGERRPDHQDAKMM